MLQAFQSVKVTAKGDHEAKVGRVVRQDGEIVLVLFEGEAEPLGFNEAELTVL